MTSYVAPVGGFTTLPEASLLAERANDYLAGGPASASALISSVCQLPAVPAPVAEHMAATLFAGRREFARGADGLWRLATVASVELPIVQEATVREPAPTTPIESLSYTVVDVETTGSSPERGHRVTEIAAVRVENGEVRDVFETLVNPERSIPPFITALTSISWEMVKDAPKFRDVCAELLARMEGTVFVAHNATFDWKFVSAEVARATGRTIEGRRLCTVRLARAVLPQLRRKSLDWVANHYGVLIEGRHRAAGDAVATAHCLLRMLKTARLDHACDTLDHVDRLTGARASRRRTRRPPAMPTPVTRDTTA